MVYSAESFGLDKYGPVELASEPEDGKENRNGDPLQTPRSSFSRGYPLPESKRAGVVLHKRSDCLRQKEKDH